MSMSSIMSMSMSMEYAYECAYELYVGVQVVAPPFSARLGLAMAPLTTKIFRTTPFGTGDCGIHARPFPDLEAAERRSRAFPWFHGPLFAANNRIAARAFLEAGWKVMDVYAMSSVRADMHLAESAKAIVAHFDCGALICRAQPTLTQHALSMGYLAEVSACPNLHFKCTFDCLHYCPVFFDIWSAIFQNMIMPAPGRV